MPEAELPDDLRAPLDALFAEPSAAAGTPDRFVYTVRRGDQEVTVGETALDDDGRRLMRWLLARR